ncbi:MAG TPA: hypothetical protein GXZ99_06860, partial [Bacteroidales bacterium]|nr:hypothetical protein [Bacteroidales bacterium]
AHANRRGFSRGLQRLHSWAALVNVQEAHDYFMHVYVIDSGALTINRYG